MEEQHDEKIITYRNKTNFDAEKFIEESLKEIRESDLKCECNLENTQIEDQNCVNCIADSSRNVLASNYNDKCPEVTKQITDKEHAKWFNSELREAKKKKRRMEDKWKRRKKPNDEYWSLYKIARNQYNQLIEKTKRKYYKKLFSEEKNPKKKIMKI